MPIHEPDLDAPLACHRGIVGPGQRVTIAATHDVIDQVRQSMEVQLIRNPPRALFRQPLIGEERAPDDITRVGVADDVDAAIGMRAQEVLYPAAELSDVQDVVRARLVALEVGDGGAVALRAW
jgi:hypothetical protein